MIDIHSHILPYADDGSRDMKMSVEMAEMYLKSGINTVIATPHYIGGITAPSVDNNRETLEKLRKELFKEGLDLEVFLGNEAYISMNLIRDIEEEKLLTLNGTRYIVIELPMFDIPLYVENMIYGLLLKGYIPIIAHPERNTKIMEDPNILYNYINKGALVQLNLPSLEGRYGSKIKGTAEIFIEHKMIHFVGTDAHTNRGRSPMVNKALEILGILVSKEDFEKLTYGNARLLLDDKIIDIKSPIRYRGKKGLLGIFRRDRGTGLVSH